MVTCLKSRREPANLVRPATGSAPRTASVDDATRTSLPCWLYQMVENMPVAVILIDPATSKITYLNKTGEDLLHPVRHLLPGVPEWLEGCGMEIFHPDLAAGQLDLSDPANLPWGTRVQIKNEVFELRVAAIRDRQGRYVGPIATVSPRAWTGVSASGDLPRAIAAIGEETSASGRLAERIAAEVRRTVELIETLNQTTADMGVAINQIQDITTRANMLTINAATLSSQSKAESYLCLAS